MSTGNTYGATSSTFGGGIPVFRSIDPNGKWQGGGIVQNIPVVGTVIAAGHPVEIDTAAHTAKLANFFKLHTAVETGDAVVKVLVIEGTPRLKQGNFVGVPAATVGGAVTAVEVGAITEGVGYDQFAITPNALGALAQYSLLTETVAAGSSLAYAQPNALTANDVYVETGTTVVTVDGVHTGTVYAERCPYMSAGVKANLPTIKFDNAH